MEGLESQRPELARDIASLGDFRRGSIAGIAAQAAFAEAASGF
jgi:hypothetical protein